MVRYSKRKVSTMVDLFLTLENDDIMEDVKSVELFAWVGEDEYGSGVIGIKQAMVPAGIIPIVATTLEKVNQKHILNALDLQGKIFGKKIMLCRFKFEEIITEIGAIQQ